MNLDLEKTAPSEHLYLKVYQYYRELIQKGQLPPGTKMPSLRKCAAELCLSLLFFPFSISKIGSYRVLANILLKRSKRFSSDFPSRLGASGLAILAFDPHFGYQSGFLLGYFLSFLFYFAFNVKGKRKRVFSRLFLILICLPASLSSSSGTLHLLSPLYAFLLSPLLSLIYLAGLFSFFFFPVPGLVNPLGEGLKGALTVFLCPH